MCVCVGDVLELRFSVFNVFSPYFRRIKYDGVVTVYENKEKKYENGEKKLFYIVTIVGKD